MWLDTILEIYICVILTIEYIYDKRLNEHVKSLKKRTKKRYEFESLTEGEGK
jgi:hypothetical protein